MVDDRVYDVWGTTTSGHYITYNTSLSVDYDMWGDAVSTNTLADYCIKTIMSYNTSDYRSLYKQWVTTSTKTITASTVWDWRDSWVLYESDIVRKSPSERLREIIRSRQSPLIIGSRKYLSTAVDPKEVRARETLRRVLGEEKFRKYLKDGFTSVRAKSGKVYQIYPGHGITRVYDRGIMIERLCVVLAGNFPPTDSLIMRYLLILNDERDFRNHAIVHPVVKKTREPIVSDRESLTTIWNRVRDKVAA